jgi:hypothetical protein
MAPLLSCSHCCLKAAVSQLARNCKSWPPISDRFSAATNFRECTISPSWHQAPWGSRPELYGWGGGELNPCTHSPYAAPLTRGWVCLLWIGFNFVKCIYHAYSKLLKILPCALYTSPLSFHALQSRLCLSYLSYATVTATWKVVSLLYFLCLDSPCPVLHTVHSHDFIWLLLVAFIILLHTQGRLKALCKLWIGAHLRKFPVVWRILFCRCCNFFRCLPLIPRQDKYKPLLM